ncbi:MAG TPA: LON peptidase substrate-binding domain-containing protein [Acidimicrobiales bacterium]|nr:LON peptidase substrate-binding domain-containing protein [Acidimicrobiales bacterium]
MPAIPMFPLGSVLFPSLVLPLHIFEPRYRALIHDVLDGDREFGVCLIERGAEVGGEDVRTTIGTVAQVHEAEELPDGRWAVVAVGVRRIRVERWLPDDPYPRAEVVDLPDPEPSASEVEVLPEVVARLRTALARAAELGDTAVPATVELSIDPAMASHQASALAPIATIDQHALLSAETVGLRLARLHDLLGDAIEVLDLRLAAEGPGS